ncbi:histone deacetylase family protein [Parvicella tangerina]|uniref:Acetoin utilization protein AcuC n=1 Tax=Parvicella tangerina TaxID=2829795 RepID=A0A916JK24_9FLAO|nr:histone deacetylase [Parvicella tangerina]CAG5077506.1 Acetoin utilization protein AcuC [Parvicella tangerina]
MLKVSWDERYILPLPEKHRFPMEKYDLLPKQLLYEGTIVEENIFSPRRATVDEVLACHTIEYLEKLQTLSLDKNEIRRTGFPLTRELVERELLILGGTISCADYALENKVSMNIAGGTHHAYSDRGEGFCLLNDQAVAAMHLIKNSLAKRVLIVDLDVHQGNGTAQIFEKNPAVFTLSMHGASNYPMKKESSDLDIPLPDGIQDAEYLSLMEYHIKETMDTFQPDFIFYQSGVDVLATDKLGRLSLTREGCKERDRFVLSLAKEYDLPIVCSMGGGYSEHIKDIVEAHSNTYRLAQEIFF